MDDVFPTASTSSRVVVDDEYNIPRNVINPQLVKEVREANRQSADESSILPAIATTSSPTHRPLILPTTKGRSELPQISLSPPTEETGGELVQRQLFGASKRTKPAAATLVAALVLVILLLIILLLLLIEHI